MKWNESQFNVISEFKWEKPLSVRNQVKCLLQSRNKIKLISKRGWGGMCSYTEWQHNETNEYKTKQILKNGDECVFVFIHFSMYTEIKGPLRRWNCVYIQAFGSLSQRWLCCHGNACWTKVPWIFQQSPTFSSDHLGSFDNPHNIQNFFMAGGGASRLQ